MRVFAVFTIFTLDCNALCLPPKILHNLFIRFLLGRLLFPGEIGNNGYGKFWGVNKVHYGLCEKAAWGSCGVQNRLRRAAFLDIFMFNVIFLQM